jgi:hypothetical protein
MNPNSCLQQHPLIPCQLGNSVDGPEKAGVGGSTPSLATIVSSSIDAGLSAFS